MTISDDRMKQRLSQTKSYTLVVWKATPKRHEPAAEKIVWEHGRRNFLLMDEGILPIVCPMTSIGEISGIGIFAATLEETRKIMSEDPAVNAGIFTYEMQSCLGFPGAFLP